MCAYVYDRWSAAQEGHRKVFQVGGGGGPRALPALQAGATERLLWSRLRSSAEGGRPAMSKRREERMPPRLRQPKT
eukprot:s639_g8.t1